MGVVFLPGLRKSGLLQAPDQPCMIDPGGTETMFEELLKSLAPAKILPYDLADIPLPMLDLGMDNKQLEVLDLSDTRAFITYVDQQLSTYSTSVALGAYDEDRIIYRRSSLFDAKQPRSIHIGIDIWTKEGTSVIAPVDGEVHSFQDNRAYGDYGPTVILRHTTEGVTWHTLYGHLSRSTLPRLSEGMKIPRETVFAWVGTPEENGQWPSHLHFQIIRDMEGRRGDYPGVCTQADRRHYLSNCPDPLLLLGLQV